MSDVKQLLSKMKEIDIILGKNKKVITEGELINKKKLRYYE